jgi:hypothetical protein
MRILMKLVAAANCRLRRIGPELLDERAPHAPVPRRPGNEAFVVSHEFCCLWYHHQVVTLRQAAEAMDLDREDLHRLWEKQRLV